MTNVVAHRAARPPAPRWFLRFVLLFLLVTSRAYAQTPVTEDDLRAAMVQHLTSFVDWPPAKLDATHPQFTVCLLGGEPIRAALEAAFRNRTVFSKPAIVQRLAATDKIDGCHMLYIGSASRKDFLRLLPALEEASVLTVSERGDAQGQVIGLPTEDDHIVIRVDLHAAQASRLTLSSRLLHLATLVNKP